MANINTISTLTSAVTTRYTQRYQRAAKVRRLYDQLAGNVASAPQYELEQRRGMGSTYTFNFASDLTPGSTAISETADVTPQLIYDATSTITPTSRGEAIQWSEKLDLEAYTDFVAFRAEKVGESAMETIDNLAKAAALQGSLVLREAARTSLDAATAAQNWNEAAVWKASAMTQTLKCPPFVENGRAMFLAIAHPDAFYDLFHSGNVVSAIMYGGLPGNILFTGEVGSIANFKLIISPWAKVFGGIGAAHNDGSSDAYLLSAASNPLATTLSVTTGTNCQYGRVLTIGTAESGDTHYDTNEQVRWISGTTTATIVGSGANGGTRFAHAVTDYALNSDSVFPVAYGSPFSLAKVFASDVGEFGQMVGPENDGLLDQWTHLGYKYYGNYGRIAENYILRGEYSSSLDAT